MLDSAPVARLLPAALAAVGPSTGYPSSSESSDTSRQIPLGGSTFDWIPLVIRVIRYLSAVAPLLWDSGRRARLDPAAPGPHACSLRLQAPGLRPQASGLRLQASGLRPQASGSRLPAPGLRLQASGFRPQASGFRLLPTNLSREEPGPGSRPECAVTHPVLVASRRSLTGLVPADSPCAGGRLRPCSRAALARTALEAPGEQRDAGSMRYCTGEAR